MGDQFEKFVSDNLSDFDVGTDGDPMWKRIEEGLEKKSGRSYTWIWKAAAVLFLFSTSLLLVDRFSQSDKAPLAMSEFEQAETYYIRLIAQKKSEITSYESRQLTEDFLKEIEYLDEMYDELKSTFGKKTVDQKLTDAMISNLQLRLNILEQQLKILEQLNRKNNEDDSNIEI